MDPQLHAAIEKDSLSTSSTRKDGTTIIIWVASNDIIGENGSVLALLDRHKKFCKTLEHGVWKQITSKMKTLLEKQYSLENGYDLNSITLQQLNPYQAVVETKGNTTVRIKFDEMQFAVGHSFVEGTCFHTRALERLTNPLFQESSTDVYKRTKMATTIEGGGCRVSKNRDPPSLQHSYTFSEMVSFEKWDCVIANTTNLLQSIGHWDTFIQKKIGHFLHKGSFPALLAVEQGLRGPYDTIHLPKEMNYTMLLDVSKKLCLPLIVPLSLNCKGTQCTHTIGIYPIRPIGGGPFQFRIVDGAHPDLKSIALSIENLDWCCGESLFTKTAGGFALLPTFKQSKKFLESLNKICQTPEELCSLGISICLDKETTVNVPDYVQGNNVVEKTLEEYRDIAAQPPALNCHAGQLEGV